MHIKVSILFSAQAVLSILLVCGQHALPQQRRTDRIGTLISGLSDKNEYDTQRVSGQLIRLGRRVAPRIVESLKANNGCHFKINAARVLLKIDPKNAVILPTLHNVASFKCGPSLTGTLTDKHEFILNFNAALILVAEVKGGIPLVAEFFNDPELRSMAAMAFLGLAERLERRPDAITDPVIVRDARAAIPQLIKALDDEDKFVQCRTYAAIWRMGRSIHADLRAEATRALEGISDRCP